ncbi:MAG: purine-nucleoside phosphorylase, partial [Desulfovibrio sp.]|nr:purine-nucleoside phosphorylase [Desulfovibrio sp.]
PCTQSLSHKGKLVVAENADKSIVLLSGRVHLFEGKSASEVCHGVRVLHSLGVQTLIVTNASGALNPEYTPGTLLCVEDQINYTGVSPLTGSNNPDWGVRFPEMASPFDQELKKLCTLAAKKLNIPLEHGVYIGVHGPELETPAETRMYRLLGADVIGMSSVLEVICARHLKMRVLEISCITNKNDPNQMQAVTIEEVIAASTKMSQVLCSLLLEILATLR